VSRGREETGALTKNEGVGHIMTGESKHEPAEALLSYDSAAERCAQFLKAAECWEEHGEDPDAGIFGPYRPELATDESGRFADGNCPVCWPRVGHMVLDLSTGKARCSSGCWEMLIRDAMAARTELERQSVHEPLSWERPRTSAEPGSRRFADRVLSVDDLMKLPPTRWLIAGVVPESSLVVLYGQPSSYKSFIALDWACSVVSGRDWLDRTVQGGPALYVAAEGKGGISYRVLAWQFRHQTYEGELTQLRIFPGSVDLMNEAAVDELSEYCDKLGPRLVVFDTLARMAPGADENSSKDMGLVIGAVDRLRQECGASVVVVHHSRKDGSTPRGSTAILGSADTCIKAQRTSKGRVTLHCEKQKDADEFGPINLATLRQDLPGGRSSLAIYDSSHAPISGLVKVDAARDLESLLLDYLTKYPGEHTTTELRGEMHRRNKAVSEALDRLRESGRIVRSDKGRWSTPPVTKAPQVA